MITKPKNPTNHHKKQWESMELPKEGEHCPGTVSLDTLAVLLTLCTDSG